MKKTSPLQRLVRRFVPSVAMLGHNPLVMAPLSLLDALFAAPYREFRQIPPAKLRARIGFGNRLIFNQALYVQKATNFWLHYIAAGYVTMDSNITDIGCGCGRYAHLFRTYSRGPDRYRGMYTGIDVDREMIEWSQRSFPTDHFRFEWADIYSAVYNPKGKKGPYRLPLEDGTQDFVFSGSLFSHLLPDDLENYLRESHRVLKPGARMAMTAFVLDDLKANGLLGGRWTFGHPMGPAHVENPAYPEAAVAYSRDWLIAAAERAGFRDVAILPKAAQSVLEARK